MAVSTVAKEVIAHRWYHKLHCNSCSRRSTEKVDATNEVTKDKCQSGNHSDGHCPLNWYNIGAIAKINVNDDDEQIKVV